MARIETGERRLELLEALRIADALGVDPASFLAALVRAVRGATPPAPGHLGATPQAGRGAQPSP